MCVGVCARACVCRYAIVERATQAALVAQLNILCDGFGLSGERLRALQTQAQQGRQTITLRFDVASTCTFLKTTKREERSKRTLLMSTVKTTYHHHWDFQATWCVSAYVGAFKSPDAAMALRRRTGHDEVREEAFEYELSAMLLDMRRSPRSQSNFLCWVACACLDRS